MLQIFGTVKVATFVGGAVAGALGVTALKSETARNLAITGIAKGILLKDSLAEKFSDMVDSAEDIVAEAKEKAQSDKFDSESMDPFDFDEFWDSVEDLDEKNDIDESEDIED